MKRDIILSVILHVAFVAVFAAATPFQDRPRINPDDVINVSLTSMPMPSAQKSAPVPEKIAVPQAIEPEEQFTTIPDPTSVTESKPVKKKEPPKPKEEKPDTYQPEVQTGEQEQVGAEEGTTDVSENLGIGTKFGGAAVDNASFDYPYWFIQAFSKIERNWSNPIYASQPVKCTIYFQVISSGRILKVEIEESSGIPAYDRACVRAVRNSEPLPPLPPDFADEILGIHLVFPYEP